MLEWGEGVLNFLDEGGGILKIKVLRSGSPLKMFHLGTRLKMFNILYLSSNAPPPLPLLMTCPYLCYLPLLEDPFP
jgi:hypothetical protein